MNIIVEWYVAEREDPAIAEVLASSAWICERIGKGRKQPLDPQADNGNKARAATLERRMEGLSAAVDIKDQSIR